MGSVPLITGIVLAAGESRRMGQPKALLKLGEKTFVRQVISVMRRPAIGRIVVVVGPHAEGVRQEVDRLGVTIVVNHQYHRGQLSSLVHGICEAEKDRPGGILVHPVDHPCVEASTVDMLVDSFLATRPAIVVPTFNGKRGHPVIFSSAIFRALKEAPVNLGARAVIWSHQNEVCEVSCPDRGILRNVDTVADYEALQHKMTTIR